MARPPTSLTGNERRFAENEIIVSKTDTHGVITYANRVLLRVAGYREDEGLGLPHNMIRHPHTPEYAARTNRRAPCAQKNPPR